MTELAVRLVPRIASSEPCWFAGLSSSLVEAFWTAPQRTSRVQYTTAAWLGEETSSTGLPVPSLRGPRLEALPRSLAARFSAPVIDPAIAAEAIGHALSRLAPGGALETVIPLLRAVHVVAARAPGFDFSHSEPEIPFSVLVSVPFGERHAELRLAESMLHEAMHLQLTLIEAQAAIIGDLAGVAYSPWQQCPRPAQGLLHGLYVFAAIDAWLATLQADTRLTPSDRLYADRRRAEIRCEAAAVAALPFSDALTPLGRALAAGLLARVGSVAASVPASTASTRRLPA